MYKVLLFYFILLFRCQYSFAWALFLYLVLPLTDTYMKHAPIMKISVIFRKCVDIFLNSILVFGTYETHQTLRRRTTWLRKFHSNFSYSVFYKYVWDPTNIACKFSTGHKHNWPVSANGTNRQIDGAVLIFRIRLKPE